MAAMSPMSVRDFFNLMSYRRAKPGLSVDDVIHMDLKANSVNLKKTGHSNLHVGANTAVDHARGRCTAMRLSGARCEYSPDFIN
jgi:hypothetical protein